MTSSLTRSDWGRIAVATVLAFVALAVAAALGVWQFDRAHRDDITREVLAKPAVPVQSLVQPAQYVFEFDFAHAVTVSGRLDGGKALMSCDRSPADCLVFAPVQVTPTHAMTVVTYTCARAACLDRLRAVRASGNQDVDLRGRLQPAEVMARPAAMLDPTDEVPYLSTNELVMRWGIALLDGYVVVDGLDLQLVTPPSGISLRNLAYAWQWWTFAAFIVFLLVRYTLDVRADSMRRERRP